MMPHEETEKLIIQAVRELSRHDTRIFPRKVVYWRNRRIGYSESALRGFMRDMWQRGLLERPGGEDSRRGYTMPV